MVTKAKKRIRKPSAKSLAARRKEYAAKFFPYIEKVARRLARRLPAHVEIDDLVSAGVIGLMEAAERFDPKRVDRFEAFAEFRIRGAMLDDLRARDTLSRDMRRLSNELREATRRLESELGRSPDQSELAKTLGLKMHELHTRQQKLSGASVVGFDDVEVAAFIEPPLTTVRQAMTSLGSLAVDIILGQLHGAAVDHGPLLRGDLIVRQSTGPARG